MSEVIVQQCENIHCLNCSTKLVQINDDSCITETCTKCGNAYKIRRQGKKILLELISTKADRSSV